MREVYAVGVGITSFTRLEYPISEIAAYPAMMALKDAGLSKVDHVYVANMGSARLNHQSGLASAVVDTLSLTPAGAEVIDTTTQTQEEVTAKIVELARSRGAATDLGKGV